MSQLQLGGIGKQTTQKVAVYGCVDSESRTDLSECVVMWAELAGYYHISDNILTSEITEQRPHQTGHSFP